MYETFSKQLANLSDDALLYPGHDYLLKILRLTMDREPNTVQAVKMLEKFGEQDPANAHVTTLGEEKKVNVFFRLQNPTIIARLRESFPEVGENPGAREVFLKLRELRNAW